MFSMNGKGGSLTSLISNGTKVQGNIEFSDHMEIEGELVGNIEASEDSSASLRVAEGGAVYGEIRVPNIVINGSVEGDIFAGEHIELANKANIKGTIYYKSIEMVKGAIVSGQLRQLHEEVKKMDNE